MKAQEKGIAPEKKQRHHPQQLHGRSERPAAPEKEGIAKWLEPKMI